jgi:hypothetical protein
MCVPDGPRHGQGRRYRARWVDEEGKERSASIASERAAKQHLKSVARGEYANRNGRMTFTDFYKQWSVDQPWAALTRSCSASKVSSSGVSRISQIDEAVATLEIALTADEISSLETPYTPRHDFQGISDDADIQAIMARIPQLTAAT